MIFIKDLVKYKDPADLCCPGDKTELHGDLMKHIALLLVFLLALGACSPRKMAVREMTSIVETGMTALEQDDDLKMLEQALPANIKLLEMILASSPEDADLLTLLSRSYGSYTFMLLEPKFEASFFRAADPDADKDIENIADQLKIYVSRYYKKGADFAMQALEINHPGASNKLKKVDTIEPFLQTLGKKDVPALFWYGFNLAAWVNLNLDSVKALSQAHIAERCMRRVIELQPNYFNGSAHLVLIAYYASRPPMMGGNLDAARGHYTALKKLLGDSFLMTDLFFARYYLPQTQDRQAFETLLADVKAASQDDAAFPLFNAVAGSKAGIYLEGIDALFEPLD